MLLPLDMCFFILHMRKPIKLNCDIDIDFIKSKGGQFSVTNVDKGMAESE